MAEGPKFTPKQPGQSHKEYLRSVIEEGSGMISMCWSPTPIGKFEDERAIQILEAMFARLGLDD
jgi:hypothetical protein